MSDKVDWEKLAVALGALSAVDGRRYESGGSVLGRAALSRIVGEAVILDAVRYYVARKPGCELARSVLRLLRAESAMTECDRIIRESPKIEERRTAVELLRAIADRSVIVWVGDYLADPDEIIQGWAIGILDQLALDDLIEGADVADLLTASCRHNNARVREVALGIRELLDDNSS